MKELSLYRRRLIPEECIALPDDMILLSQDGILVTSWKTIRPKPDMDHGYSCYYLKEGYKVSKFYRRDDSLLYYYCDIISPFYDKDTGKLTVTDLLADVIIYPDGFVKVVDLDELVTASDEGKLTADMLRQTLLILNRLLTRIYAGQFKELLTHIDRFDRTGSGQIFSFHDLNV